MFLKTTHFLALKENDVLTVYTQCLHMTNILMKFGEWKQVIEDII